MRGRDIIKEIIKVKGLSNVEVATKLSISPAALWERMNNKNVKDIPVSKLSETIDVLDYQVVVLPKDVAIEDGWYVVDGASPKTADLDLDALLND